MQWRNYYFILSVVGGTIAYLLLFFWWRETRLGISMISNVMVIIGAVWTGWLMRRDRTGWRLWLPKPSQWKRIGGALLIFTGIVLGVLWMYRDTIESYLALTTWRDSVGYAGFVWIMVYYTILSVPLQELIFRGYFLRVITLTTGRGSMAVLGSSTLYALAHFHYGWEYIAGTFGFGLVLGIIMYRWQRLAWPIYLHLIVGVGLVVNNVVRLVP